MAGAGLGVLTCLFLFLRSAKLTSRGGDGGETAVDKPPPSPTFLTTLSPLLVRSGSLLPSQLPASSCPLAHSVLTTPAPTPIPGQATFFLLLGFAFAVPLV